jgi:hypothetical protein
MKATELRIGNYIYGNMNEICIVTELGNVLNPNLVSYREVSNIKAWGQNRQKPIPLTEEWLLKFGFEKEGGWFKKKRLLLFNIRNMYFTTPSRDIVSVDVTTVNQLQTLYFALTGEELTLKNTHND